MMGLARIENGIRRHLHSLNLEGIELLKLPEAQWSQLWGHFMRSELFVMEADGGIRSTLQRKQIRGSICYLESQHGEDLSARRRDAINIFLKSSSFEFQYMRFFSLI